MLRNKFLICFPTRSGLGPHRMRRGFFRRCDCFRLLDGNFLYPLWLMGCGLCLCGLNFLP